MVTEPQTIRDVWYMVETSPCCHLYYTSLCSFDEMEIGCRTERYTDVEVDYNYNAIYVVTYESECMRINREKRGYSTQSVIVDTQTYHSISEFKDSVFWEDFLTRFKGGNSDSSWLDDMHITQDCRDGVVQIDCEFGKPSWDGLNRRYRTAKSHTSLSLAIDALCGTISIEADGHAYDFTLKDIEEMVDTMNLLESHNITIDKYEGICIPLGAGNCE